MLEKDIEEIRSELMDYYGTAMVNGFPMAVVDLDEIERMDEDELREMAEELGLISKKQI